MLYGNCKLNQKHANAKKKSLLENNVCHLAYSCVNIQYAQDFDISIHLGVWISDKYVTFNCVIDLSKILEPFAYESILIQMQTLSWFLVLSDNFPRKLRSPQQRLCVLSVSFAQPFTLKTVFRSRDHIFNLPLFAAMFSNVLKGGSL